MKPNPAPQGIPNARFWAHINGSLVKVTLRPHEERHWGKAWDTDEGWSSIGRSWIHAGDDVLYTQHSDGRDCDGRLRSMVQFICPLSELAARPAGHALSPDYFDPTPVRPEVCPPWQKVDETIWDYQAIAAGY